MKTIEVDEELYRHIASHTQHIGESASDILRRMLNFPGEKGKVSSPSESVSTTPVAQIDTCTNFIAQEMVSTTIGYNSDAYQTLENLLTSDTLIHEKKSVNRFIAVLTALYHIDSSVFKTATESLQGRTRLYFADSQQTLLQHGTHTKPKHIYQTPYWVITNTNSDRKRSMVESIMKAMQIPLELIERVISAI